MSTVLTEPPGGVIIGFRAPLAIERISEDQLASFLFPFSNCVTFRICKQAHHPIPQPESQHTSIVIFTAKLLKPHPSAFAAAAAAAPAPPPKAKPALRRSVALQRHLQLVCDRGDPGLRGMALR